MNPKKPGRPSDDVSSAPESGTVRDETSGNNPANRGERPLRDDHDEKNLPKDDPSLANEAR
jgi:hypothetical protein